jgi:hypothetical protein
MDFFEYLEKVQQAWRRIPDQGKRLVVLLAIVVVVFIPVRSSLIPDDFGKIGHYRASALQEAAALDIQYAGHQLCNDCHDDIVETKATGHHLNVNCEVCHGPSYAHAEADDPDEMLPIAPRGRDHCPMCHGYLASRPTGFPQIVTDSHHPLKACISCHDPHEPAPDTPPTECEACHATIARTKALSHHIYIECTHCHSATEEHKLAPRQHRPTKPRSREFCGECHAEDTDVKDVTTVDMETHGEGYVCWQCHYPHLPEAR